jgi:Uma2 family endonuclease
MASAVTLMTAEELLALPDDGVERWLINGVLRERPMSYRNRFHSRIVACLTAELEFWLRRQPSPRGQVLTGDAGVQLTADPDTLFGVAVVSVTAELLARQPAASTIIQGVPTLAVEVLSPNDTDADVNDKIDAFLAAGVPQVWIIHPRRRMVTVYRPGAGAEVVNAGQDLTAEPHLPGLRIAVAQLFE